MWGWPYLLLDGVIVVSAAGLGWLLTRRWRRSNVRRANTMTVGFVVAAIAGSLLIAPVIRDRRLRSKLHAAGLTLYGNERAAGQHAQAQVPILKHPKLMARLQAAKAAHRPDGAAVGLSGQGTGFAELNSSGMARLALPELDVTFEIKRALAALSPELCAGFWTGTHRPQAITEGLRKLDPAQQERWIAVSARAVMLELDATALPARIAAATVDQALADLVQSLPFDGRAAYAAASSSSAPTPAEACAAFVALADGMKALSDDQRETIIRMTNNPALVDP